MSELTSQSGEFTSDSAAQHTESNRCFVKLNRYFLILGALALTIFSATSHAIPAFPGAEGFGADSLGGRGGRVIKVTNLNDSGSGSFRAAVSASGPRIVVFEVSGIINLSNEVRITEPYLTIAGQTSPGGILITGRRTIIQTHNVIIRFLRFRVGSHRVADGADPGKLDALDFYGPARDHPPGVHDVIIDHSSLSWGTDETFTTSYAATDYTVQWCIISEALNSGHPEGNHSKGFLTSAKDAIHPINVSFHHNYVAHNRARNPEIDSNDSFHVTADIRNNVIYNFHGASVGKSSGHARVNYVENYVKAGPDSHAGAFEFRHTPYGSPQPSIYVYRNIGMKEDGSDPLAWNIAEVFSQTQTTSEAWRTMTPWSAPTVATSSMSVSYANEILDTVGASRPFRDEVDVRVVNDFRNGTGGIIEDVDYPADFPTFMNLSPPVDQDNDGMADNWENSQGFNTSTDDSALDHDSDGYTNIEEYLHFLAGDGDIVAQIPPAAPTNLVAQ